MTASGRRDGGSLRTCLVAAVLLCAACRAQPPASSAEPVPQRAEGPARPAAEAPDPALRDPWQEARRRGIDFRALGQEPGWYLEIDRERSMHLVYDYAERQATTPYVQPRTEGRHTTYRASTATHDLTVVVEQRECHDGMSGQRFPTTVTVTIGDRTLHGCGRALDDERPWIADAQQVGPVRIGMTIAQAEAALGGGFDPPADAGDCAYRRTSAGPDGVLFMEVGGRIVRVDMTAGGVRTPSGAGVGATEDAVRQAYGRSLTVSPHKYTDGRYLTVAPATGFRIVFETDGRAVTRYRVGRVPEVEWVEGCS